ncbi:MAG: hypothetical protein MZV70_64740 [Desulfobacterales bacterium]|nr:hypothetical protein [Desulfobacterales bacterium]
MIDNAGKRASLAHSGAIAIVVFLLRLFMVYFWREAGATAILPIIVINTSPSIILPAMDLKFHLRDVFIKSLHFWIVSNRRLGVNL